MASELLVDCFNVSVGATQLARVNSAEFVDDVITVKSAGGDIPGDFADDVVAYDLSASLNTEDPIIVPTVAAIVAPSAIEATGLLVNTASTYRKHTLTHGVLVGIDLTLEDMKAGTANFQFRNQAAAAATLPTEHPVAAGVAPVVPTRRGTTRILAAGSQFTPDGGAAMPIVGWQRVSWRAQAIVADGEPDGGSLFVDQVTVVGWRITGSIAIKDQSLAAASTLGQRLTIAGRGTLTAVAQVTGRYDEAVVPADQTFVLERVKFTKVTSGFAAKGKGTVSVEFNALLKDAAGAALTLAEMLTVA